MGESIMGYADGVSVSVDQLQPEQPWHDVWVEYWWQQNLPDHSSYQKPNFVFDFLIGLGTYPNHHCRLGSLTYKFPQPAYNDALVDRFKDPGTGAFSYSMGKEPIVYRGVKAGHEIFLDYGYCDRDDGYLPEWSDFIVMQRDFEDAIDLIRGYDEGLRNQMDYDQDGNLVLYKRGVSVYTYDLLPQTQEEFDELMAQVKSTGPSLEKQVAERSLHKRTPEWIQENGICMMNLLPKKSTIHSAGRGAFAQFAFKKGDLISPMPLLQLIDKDFPQNEVLVNYCFRHPESSMMLCPMSNAALINHCSERTKGCKGGKPNAAYRWASDWDPTTAKWRKMSWPELKKQHERGLSFEIVALRDIEPGEEIFFDYGEEWEEAWAQHAKEWTPPPALDGFLTAKEANDGDKPILDNFLSGDLRNIVVNNHLFTGCQYWLDEEADTHEFYKDTSIGDWRKLSDDQILERFSDDGRDYSKGVSYSTHESWSYWPCTVVRQEDDGDGLYTVRIHQTPFEGDADWHQNQLPRILTGYHREGIHYFVKPGRSDQHLPGVFRQSIGIRDDMIPDDWKDLRE